MMKLENYLIDCENKRRRSRDRPSNEVLSELRRLLTQLEDAASVPTLASPADSDGDGALEEAEPMRFGDLGSISPNPLKLMRQPPSAVRLCFSGTPMPRAPVRLRQPPPRDAPP